MEILVMLLGIYLVPTIVALARGHSSTAAVIIINVFLGWTLVGWVLALAWAAAHFTPKPLPILDLGQYPRLPPRRPVVSRSSP
jgi:uncharacterized membrane protein YqaE (UPF0057 family)